MTDPKVSISTKIRTALDDIEHKCNVLLDSTRRIENRLDDIDVLTNGHDVATTDPRPRPRSKGLGEDVNGISIIRHLNEQAVEQEIEKRKLEQFEDVDPVPASVLRGMHLDDVNTVTAPQIDDDGHDDDGHDDPQVIDLTAKYTERLEVVASRATSSQCLAITMASEFDTVLSTAMILICCLEQDDQPLADEIMEDITAANPLAGLAVIRNMTTLMANS